MRSIVLFGVLGGVLTGCSSNVGQEASSSLAVALKQRPVQSVSSHAAPIARSTIADLPDRGSLLAYTATAPSTFGATTWREVKLSEARALRAVADKGMVVEAPDGRPIRLQYARHVDHANGNWTWIGRPAGARPGEEAVLTFGPRAVFGMIPDGNGGLLEVTTRAGKTWIGQTATTVADAQAMAADMLQAPAPRTGSPAAHTPRVSAAAAPVSVTAQAAATASTATVDLVAGYTLAFATRLGGTSQAITRLNFLVDIANQAYANSNVNGQLRLVATVPVDYADATLNRTALFELTGVTCTTVASGLGQHSLPDRRVNCTAASTPAALKPLLAAKLAYGADLGVLVRNYSVPENGSCGVAWLLGGGQQPITAADAPFGLAVISDSNGSAFPSSGNTCRNETLVHELGHNMGLAHNVEDAQGSTDTNGDGNLLDPEEFGRYADSFGYNADSAHGNFYTIMSVPVAGQTSYRVFSNPNLTTCGGNACGIAGQADNARTLGLTMPVIARFAAPRSTSIWLRGDFNGDHKADILWRNTSTGDNVIWLSGNKSTSQAVDTVATNWYIAGVGDFNGDGRADIVWRNVDSGANVMWPSGQRSARVTLPTVDTTWTLAAVADFNGDHKADVIWHNTVTGANTLWPSANRTLRKALGTIADSNWTIAAAADFNGDGRADILWRNTATGANVKWPSAQQAYKVVLPTVAINWTLAAAGDFDKDGHSDIVWRDGTTGANTVWRSANRDTRQSIGTVTDTNWYIAGAGDFNGDGHADLLWHSAATGASTLWLSANQTTKQALATVADLTWTIGG